MIRGIIANDSGNPRRRFDGEWQFRDVQAETGCYEFPTAPVLFGGLAGRDIFLYACTKYDMLLQEAIYHYIVVKETRLLPIRPINFSDPADVARHDKMVSLVERMLELHKRAPSAFGTSPKFQPAEFRGERTPQEQEMVKREIESTDRAIDRLVYELYGLTEEEIRIVEG